MRPMSILVVAASCLLAGAAGADEYVGFFATGVVDFSPGAGHEGWYTAPERALGPPQGAGSGGSSTHVVTLGLEGALTLSFADPNGRDRCIADGEGVDFLVAENPFVSAYTGGTFIELVRVQVSTDGVHFAEFPTLCEQTTPVPPDIFFNAVDPSLYHGFAGTVPVFYDANSSGPRGQLDPFDSVAAGGDPFDLADLADVPEVVEGLVDPQCIRYVRLIDVNGDGSEVDSSDNPVYDPTGEVDQWPDDSSAVRPLSADIDAVTVIHGLYDPPGPGRLYGDTDEDGDVDFLDYLTVKANLGSGEAAGWSDGDFTGDKQVDGADVALLRERFGTVLAGPSGAAVPEPSAGMLCVAGLVGLAGRRRRGRHGR